MSGFDADQPGRFPSRKRVVIYESVVIISRAIRGARMHDGENSEYQEEETILRADLEALPAPPRSAFPAAGEPSQQLPPMPPPPGGSGVVFQIGDIGITHDTIITPNGNAPLSGSSWILTDQSRTEEKTPSIAIVLAILLFLVCFIGLLFLLMKETRTTGYAEVRVQSGGLLHMTQIPVNSPYEVAQLRSMVGQAQSMAHMAR